VSIEHAQRLTGCATSQRTLLTTSHSLGSSRLGEEERRKEDSVLVEVDCNNVCLWRTRYDSTKTPRLPDGSPCSRPQPSPHLEASSVASTQSRFVIVTDTHLRNLIHHATYPPPSIVSRVEHDCDHIDIANTFCDTPPPACRPRAPPSSSSVERIDHCVPNAERRAIRIYSSRYYGRRARIAGKEEPYAG